LVSAMRLLPFNAQWMWYPQDYRGTCVSHTWTTCSFSLPILSSAVKSSRRCLIDCTKLISTGRQAKAVSVGHRQSTSACDLSEHGVSAGPEKSRAVQPAVTAKNMTKQRIFLVLTSCYCHFVKKFAVIQRHGTD
jgi:hypothetical protein